MKCILFLRINVTEKNFCHTGNRTHDFGTNHQIYGIYFVTYLIFIKFFLCPAMHIRLSLHVLKCVISYIQISIGYYPCSTLLFMDIIPVHTTFMFHDVIMCNNISRDAHCNITICNDIAREVHYDITMSNDAVMHTSQCIIMLL